MKWVKIKSHEHPAVKEERYIEVKQLSYQQRLKNSLQ
jgi:hypothetical protein